MEKYATSENATGVISHPRLTETLILRLETRIEQLMKVDSRISTSLKELTGFTPKTANDNSSNSMQDAGALGHIYNLLEHLGDIVYKLEASADILETTV